MTKTKMKSKGRKKERTGVTEHSPLSSKELKKFYRRTFADRVKDGKDKREHFQRLRTFLITK